ncbi:hypothetical protein SPRG_12016 [Saprolegnia parasitica CBS 223.65]|uniref:Uncharacterized protein n=1 Tax=Saprolegnia parasitica (strain CBS 223.65) TaxID=695850 RepID=A0A067BWH0_SAPPC|nr:hypothetical protein SPRG_12016 [Saprolegnia parasitica CBS 223.65]KDO22879.1 hypothetical protein SPRG_12016 [Saprolegnia parasitica CBS 223.65]|eukprot:XP_012206435.1 hypothetical protein SPRG_12016 [Saprolegnia parasitica CBS 223.65]
MLLLSWQLRVFLGATSLVLLYDLIVLIALGSSYMLPYLPGAVSLSCAGASLVVCFLSLVYVFRASKLATLMPLIWLSLLHVALLTAIAVTAFMCAHDVEPLLQRATSDRAFLKVMMFDGAYPSFTYVWYEPDDFKCPSTADKDMALKQRFYEAYCAKRGHVYCDSFPMRAVLRFGLINATSGTTVRLTSASVNSTFFDVPMTNSTTLTNFCDQVAPSVLTAEPTLSALCDGCQRMHETSAFGDWIDDNCESISWIDTFSTFCISYRSPKVYPELSPACRYAMMKPRHSSTFADVCYNGSFSAKVQRDANALAASAVALGVMSLVVAIVLGRLQGSRDTVDEEDALMFEAMTQPSPATTIE